MDVRGLLTSFANISTALRDVVWPRICPACRSALLQGEDTLCLQCLTTLPRTNLHLRGYKPNDNPVIDRLVNPSVPVCRGTAWFYYVSGSPFSRIILDAKFHNQPYMLRWAGRTFASELKGSDFFTGIDIILPIPIWITRLISRGYNQSEYICRGLSEATGIPIGDHLKARRPHKSQRRRNAQQRRHGVDDVFVVRDAKHLQDQHILIVDDVLTTGSTMRSALTAVHKAVPSATLSVLTLGCTPP